MLFDMLKYSFLTHGNQNIKDNVESIYQYVTHVKVLKKLKLTILKTF